MAARTFRLDPSGSHAPDTNAQSIATLTGFTHPDGLAFKVWPLSSAAVTVTPAGEQTAITYTPTGDFPQMVPFLCRSLGAATVAVCLVTY